MQKSPPPPIATFLLTCERDAGAIATQQRRCRTNTIQICDCIESSVYRELRRELPGIALVQVIHVTDGASVELARTAAEHVDALLLDSGNPAFAVKELGGTGRVHDWETSRRIRESVSVRSSSLAALRLQTSTKRLPPCAPSASTCAAVYEPTTRSTKRS